MDQLHLYAYESLGQWHIAASYDEVKETGTVERHIIYRGEHPPIDDDDPDFRAVVILGQVVNDLTMILSAFQAYEARKT